MALYKRGKPWHTDFSVNGERFRQSLDTSDWREAQAKEKELITQAGSGKLTTSIGWSMPGCSTVRTGLPRTVSKQSASSSRRCGRAKMCTLLPRVITV